MKKQRPHAVYRSRMLVRHEVDIAGEIERIVDDAAAGVIRVVGLGELVVFSAPGGHAFVLDVEDELGCCLMHDYRRRPTPLVAEDQAGFAIAWEGEFVIERGCFWTISRDGGRSAHVGVPIGEIERLVRAAKGDRA